MRQQISFTAVDNNRALSRAGLGFVKLGTPFFPSVFINGFGVVLNIFTVLRVKKRTEWRWGKNKKRWKYTLLGSVPFQAADGAFVPSGHCLTLCAVGLRWCWEPNFCFMSLCSQGVCAWWKLCLSKMRMLCAESEPYNIEYFINGLLENKEPIKI